MIKHHRSDYLGEFVLTETRWQNGIKDQQREWIANPIENQHISNRAGVIGSRVDRDRFDYSRLRRHRGGLLGKNRLQTYGCGEIWQDLILDFWVSTDKEHCANVIANKYHEKSIAYSSTGTVLQYPGNFYVVPFQPYIDDKAAAVYLAAFDGHKEIFLLGYNNDTPTGNSAWQSHVLEVMQTYFDAQFWLVGTASNMPGSWRSCANVDTMDYRRFISYCDV